HITFRTNAGAGCAPNAVVVVDMWMLGLRSFGKKLALLGRVTRTDFPLLQALEIKEEEEKADDPANTVREERIHPLKIPQNELQSNMHQREYGKGITERFVNDVPEVEHFL